MNTVELNKITSYIDQLVKMSGAKDDPSTLDIERSAIELELAQARESLASLKSLMSPERYYNANDAIVNNAIESSLVRRNNAFELEIKAKRAKIEEKEAELATLNDRLKENASNIARSEKCIATLGARINENENLDEETLKHYQSLIDKTKSSLEVFKNEDASINESISNITAEITQMEAEIASLQNIIDTNNNYLNSTRNSSLEANTQNSILKSRDENEFKMLEDRIQELEAKRLAVLENPILVAAKAKKALLEDSDITLTLTYVRKLVDIVSKKEFMDIPFDEKFDEEIQKLLESAETERNSFAAEIEGKNYKTDNSELDQQRKSYLEERIKFYNEAVGTIRSIVNQIDSKNGLDSTANVEQIEVAIAGMEQDLESYANIGTQAALKESEIIAASNRKKDQIDSAKELQTAYELDVIADVALASSFENDTIASLELEITNAQAEMTGIESRLALQKNTQDDFVAKAIDDAKLKELANKVIAIKYRKKFKESPLQILEHIEECLGAVLEPAMEEETEIHVIEPVATTEEPIVDTVEVEEPVQIFEPIVEEKPIFEPVQVFEQEAIEPEIQEEVIEEAVLEPARTDDTLREGALKIDHILDLAQQELKEEPVIEAIEQPAEEIAPIDLSAYPDVEPIALDTFTVPKFEEVVFEAPKVEEPVFSPIPMDATEEKRGNKVVAVTPVELEEHKEVTEEVAKAVEEPIVEDELPQNPFMMSEGEGNIFDFNGDLLNSDEEENIIDFNTAADEIQLGLGGIAA